MNNLIIEKKNFKVVGYATASDYTRIIKKTSDLTPTPKNFGIGFMNEEDFKNLRDKSYSYVFKLNGVPVDKVKNIVSNNSTVTEFIKISDNSRAIGYIDDIKVNKNMSILMGFVICIMIAYMISMMIINTIDEESAIIGALYSLGYVKKEIVKHFMILPTIIVSIGAIIGTSLGFVIKDLLEKATTNTYSMPNITRIYPPYLIFIGVIIPILIVIIVNYFIISKKLNSTPLQLLRKEKKASKLNNVKINHFSFITKFRLREFLREIRGNIILFCGIFFATFGLAFGVCIYRTGDDYVKIIQDQINYNYMYILNRPIEVTENKGLEKITSKGLSIYSKDIEMDMDVILQGINEHSNFYSFSIPENDSGLYISDSVQGKFNLNVGDIITLKDKGENKIFNLKIKGVVKYKSGLNVFMNRSQLNRLLKEDKYYFNGYLSKNKLDINDDYVNSEVTYKNTIKSAQDNTYNMYPTIAFIVISSSAILIISMYLLLKAMVDKSISSISLVKIFGFNQKEINKLYLGSLLYTVLFSIVISIPISVKIIKLMYPGMTADVQAYYSISLEPKDYCLVVIMVMVGYFISDVLLKRHIKTISLSEALKNRD
ncbi:putative ABC transport system permease protein [Clostridium beijerinckii]|uniref:FtsX-like permease family protein n=1 Tax=Clostridium beijerinckii TaxID=1520 RepID=UPI0017912DE8|nr:FtsX-like permease family protein [Clostridium beijerinckii]NYC06129.1 putative ABC transport system permease protein [Clostridium beijerinckii]